MGPRSGVPHLRGSGWGVSGVSGVSWVSGFGGRVCVRGVRRFVCGGGGFGLLLAHRLGLFPVPLGLLGDGGEEEAAHLIEGGAARLFHPNGTVLRPVDTTDGAPLYPFGVGYVDDRPDDRIPGTVVLLLGTLGGVGLGGGGGGVVVAVWGGLVRLGAGTAFVGRAVVVGGGGVGPFGPGDRPVVAFVGRLEIKLSFLGGGLGGGGLGFAWGGGVGAVVVDASPPPPPPHSSRPHPCSPTSPHPPPPPAYPTSCIRAHSPGRKWRGATHTPLTTREVSPSWKPRKRARPRGGSQATMRWRDPKGTS